LSDQFESDSGPLRRSVTIVNERGLHARAAAKFVKLAGTFDAAIVVERGGVSVDGSSIMGLMMFGAGPGSVLQLSATGPDAETALSAIADLIARGFDEDVSLKISPEVG
jgi:phosphocarrier protein